MPDFGLSKDSLRNIVGLSGEFVGTTDTQVITNKTYDVQLNTLKQTTPATGSILRDNGGSFQPLARGSANQPLKVNSAGTDIGYGTLPVAGGGTGATTLTGVLIGAGTSAITTKSNPAGAFLDDSSAQNVTGAKTFSNTTLLRRNPAGTFSLTEVHPAITANRERRFYQPYDYLIYKESSTYYGVKGLTDEVIDSNTTLATVISSVITAIGANKGSIEFGPGDFTFGSTLTLTSSNDYLNIKGQGYQTRFLASTDIPVLYLDGCRYVTVENLAFANDALATKSSAFVDLGDATTFNIFNHIQMMQNNTTTTTQKGTGFRFTLDGAGASYFNMFSDVTYRGLNYCNVVDSTGSATSQVWCNSNHWVNSRAFYFLKFIQVSQKGGGSSVEGHFDANGFTGLHLQCNPTGAEQTTTVFDFEGATGDGYVTARFSDIIVWDMNASAYSLKVTPRTTVFASGPTQNLTARITGSGSGTGGAKVSPTTYDQYLDVYTATSAPSDPISTVVRTYASVVDSNNTNLIYKTNVNGSIVPVVL